MRAQQPRVELEVALVRPRGERDRLVVERKRLAGSRAGARGTARWRTRKCGICIAGKPARATDLHRVRGRVRRVAHAVLQHQHARFLVTEIRESMRRDGLSTARSLASAAAAPCRVLARHERRHFGVVDLDLHPLEAVRGGELLGVLHDLLRARVVAADLLVERAMHLPPDAVHGGHLRVREPRLDARDQRVGARRPWSSS